MDLLTIVLNQSKEKSNRSAASIRRKEKLSRREALNKIDLNHYNYVYKDSHQRMTQWKLSYVNELLKNYNLDQFNYFGIPSTTFCTVSAVDFALPENIRKRYHFVEGQTGLIFDRVKEIATQRFNAEECWNKMTRDILPKLHHDFYHVMDLDYQSHLSTNLDEIKYVLHNRLIKKNGLLFITFATRKDDLLLDFYRNCKDHKDYIDPKEMGITKTAAKFVIERLIEFVGGDFEFIECEQFGRSVASIVIRRIN